MSLADCHHLLRTRRTLSTNKTIVAVLTMPAGFNFSEPSDAAARLNKLGGGDLLSFLRSLSWSFIQSLLSSADFNFLNLANRVLEALPSEFDDVFDEVTSATRLEDVIVILRAVYCHCGPAGRSTDEIIGDCVRNWTARISDESGNKAVAEALDPIFIHEAKLAGIRRLAGCLDVIGVSPVSDPNSKFFPRSARKNQVVTKLLDFWSHHIPASCVSGFLGRFFPEDSKGRLSGFKDAWNEELIKDLEPYDAQVLASFLFPGESVSPSGSASRRILLAALLDNDDDPDGPGAPGPQPTPMPPASKRDEDQQSTSLPDFRDLSISDKGRKKNKRRKAKKSRKDDDVSADSSDDSSDDDDDPHDGASDDEEGSEFSGISPKFRSIIKHQGGPGFSDFYKPLALQVATKAELFETLTYYRSGIQCSKALCRTNNLTFSHSASKDLFQAKTIPVLLPDSRSQPQLSFPLTQRVAPSAIRHFLLSGSIVAFTHNLAERAGPTSRDTADGYLAREILCTGMTLAAMFDEMHPYPTIFLSSVERLARRLLVLERALTLEKKDRSNFFERNVAFMGIAPATSGKSLKHISP